MELKEMVEKVVKRQKKSRAASTDGSLVPPPTEAQMEANRMGEAVSRMHTAPLGATPETHPTDFDEFGNGK